MHVLIICKFDEDPIKNKDTIDRTTFSHYKSMVDATVSIRPSLCSVTNGVWALRERNVGLASWSLALPVRSPDTLKREMKRMDKSVRQIYVKSYLVAH